MSRRVGIFGLHYDSLDMSDAVELLEAFTGQDKTHLVFCLNVALTVWARRDPSLRTIYDACDVLPVDGMGIIIAARFLGVRINGPVSGARLFLEYCRRGASSGRRIYLLGAAPNVAALAAARLVELFPGLQVVGYHHGYFREEDEEVVVEDIRSKAPDAVFLAMSSPKKELFAYRHRSKLKVPVVLGIGGALDIIVGRYKWAPEWVQRSGLEWLYRLMQEPRRLWWRYLSTNTEFGLMVMREALQRLRRSAS